MNDFQMPGKEEKAEFVKTNFNVIAEKYDLFNDLNTFGMHRLWKNHIAKLYNPIPDRKTSPVSISVVEQVTSLFV